MRGSSLASLENAQRVLEEQLTNAEVGTSVAAELFTIVDALDSTPALRRALSDPASTAEAKAELVTNLLSGKAGDVTISVVKAAAGGRWGSENDLADAVSRLAIDAYLKAAELQGVLEQVEAELFAITKSLAGQRELRQAFSDNQNAPVQRAAVAKQLLEPHTHAITLALAVRATFAPRSERFVTALNRIGDIAAARRSRLVAQVSSSVELSAQQLEKIASILAKAYGQQAQVNLTVDPGLVGGLQIKVGKDFIDATVLSRLADANRQIIR